MSGPATIEYYKNGIIKKEEYYINGFLHRLSGPAIIEYDEQRNIKNKCLFVNGKNYTELQYLIMISDMKEGN